MILLGCLGMSEGGACSTPKTSFSGASQQAVEAWAANASAAPYNEKRVALLMALHPPKFGDGLAFLRSCRIAEAAREVDVYVLFSSEADKRVAMLMALHPPKFGDGLAFLRSCRIAEAAREVDVYVLFSSEADKRVWDRRAPPTTVVARA